MNSQSVAVAMKTQTQGEASKLASVLRLTQRMLEAAQQGDWVEVAEGETRRQSLLQECFQDPVEPHLAEVSAEALATMLHLNEELVALLETAKEELSAAMKGGGGQKKKLAHYLDVDSSYG